MKRERGWKMNKWIPILGAGSWRERLYDCLLVLLCFGIIASLIANDSSQPDYAETLKEWQAQQDNTQIAALRDQNAKAAAELAALQKKYSQDEAD